MRLSAVVKATALGLRRRGGAFNFGISQVALLVWAIWLGWRQV
jgi:hypothetical protein